MTEQNELRVSIELYFTLHFVLQLHACGVNLLEYLHLSSVVFYRLPVDFGELREGILKFTSTDQNLDLF